MGRGLVGGRASFLCLGFGPRRCPFTHPLGFAFGGVGAWGCGCGCWGWAEAWLWVDFWAGLMIWAGVGGNLGVTGPFESRLINTSSVS